MIAKFARLEFELFTKPSKFDFLRVHQIWDLKLSIRVLCVLVVQIFKRGANTVHVLHERPLELVN